METVHTKQALIEAMDKELAKIPGIPYSFTQPMAMRLDETVSGVKADLAIKIFGEDFKTLDALGRQVLRSVSQVRGAADEQIERKLEIKALEKALGSLSPENREVLVLARLQELKYAEIAAVMEISVGAVKVRVHRAINQLKELYWQSETQNK